MIDLELFSCAGGMSEGFRRAGIHFDMAVDLAKDHCDSYERNLGHRPVQMDARDLLRMARLGWRTPVRLLVADPPCTPWSRAGKRQGTADQRDMLRETADLIALLRPRAYLIGNVPGLEDSNNLPIVQEVIGGLARHGYCVRDFAALDAADYGVPQHRVRPFWFGHLHGPCLRWPRPTHGDPRELQDALPGVDHLEPWVTCGQALGHLTPKELGRMVKLRRRKQHSPQHGSLLHKPARVVGTSNLSDGNVVLSYAANHPPSFVDEPAMTVRAGNGAGATRAMQMTPRGGRAVRAPNNDDNHLDRPAHTVTAAKRGHQALLLNDRHAPASLDAPAPTMLAKYRGNAAQMLSLERRGTLPQSQRMVDADRPADTLQAREDRLGTGMTMTWPWPRPSTTITTRNQQPPPGRNGRAKGAKGSRAHERGVLLSEKAAAILQGFPEDWAFSGATKKVRWSQIGQAMPPALAHGVASSIVAQMALTVDDGPPEGFVPWSPPLVRAAAAPAEQVLLPLPKVCPQCCAELLARGMAIAGEICQGCAARFGRFEEPGQVPA